MSILCRRHVEVHTELTPSSVENIIISLPNSLSKSNMLLRLCVGLQIVARHRPNLQKFH